MRGVRRAEASEVLYAVAMGGRIQPETAATLCTLLEQKTKYTFHLAVEINTGCLLKTVDNEADAQETIRRLSAAPNMVSRKDRRP